MMGLCRSGRLRAAFGVWGRGWGRGVVVVVGWGVGGRFFASRRRHSSPARAPPHPHPHLQPRGVPGPTEYPLIGALAYVLHFHGRVVDCVAHGFWLYGEGATWSAKWPLAPRHFFTACPVNVEHLLKGSFDNYVKGSLFSSNLGSLLGRGIFVVDGGAWKAQRRTASHMFSLNEFRANVMSALVRHGGELREVVARDAGGGGRQVDMQALYFRYTLDTIGDVAFGDSIGSLKRPDVAFAAAFDTAQSIVEKRFLLPGWQVVEHLNGTRATLDAAVGVMDEYAQALITRRRETGDYLCV